MTPESEKGLGEIPLLPLSFFWTTFLSNLLFTNAAKSIIKYCHFLSASPSPEPASEQGSRIPAGRRWQEHQFAQFAQFARPAAQPGCEFGLGLGHGPCGGGSGLTPGGMPSPLASISLSAHRWILACVRVSLPLQPPPWYLSILLVHHYANIEISLCMIMETVTLETFSDHVPSLLTASAIRFILQWGKGWPPVYENFTIKYLVFGIFFSLSFYLNALKTQHVVLWKNEECKMQPS